MVDRSTFLQALQANANAREKHYKKRMKMISWFRLALAIILLGLSYWAMQPEGPSYWLWSWVLGIPLFLLMVRLYEDFKEKRNFYAAQGGLAQEELDAREGKLNRAAVEIEVPAQHSFARELDLFGKGSLHQHINRSFSKAGAKVLAREMMAPPYEDWQARQAFFKELAEDSQWAMDYRAQGEMAEDKPQLLEVTKSWENLDFKAFPRWYWPFLVLGILAVWYTGLLFALTPQVLNFQFLLLALSFNLVILGSRSKVLRDQQSKLARISDILENYSHLLKMLEEREFASSYGNNFKEKFKLNKDVSRHLKKLSALLSSLDQSANVVALFVLNGLFHYHLFRLRVLEKWHQKHASALSDWLLGLYYFEAYLSIANYHQNHPDFTWPELSEQPHFEANSLGHPLINAKQRVSNDLKLAPEKYIILTGSNMSGKSTFLRSIGVNMVLAQLGAKVAAQSLRVYPFQLLASMNPQDDLRAETSYFQAEILRLSGLLNKLNQGRFSFFLLDEILRGTNSDDKQAGTQKFLKKIEEAPAWGLIATHDVDIAHMADDNQNFRAAFFESKVVDEDLVFDYKLREGICKTPNASLLMQRYGLI